MIEDHYLPFFITEQVYLLKEPVPLESVPKESVIENVEKPTEIVQEPIPTIPTPKIYDLAIWTPPLTKADRELLTKILKAIKKDFNLAFLMEGINSYQPHYRELLCFGYQKELELKLGSLAELYQPTNISDKKVLVSMAPADLQSDKNEKALLWEALQKMFLK